MYVCMKVKNINTNMYLCVYVFIQMYCIYHECIMYIIFTVHFVVIILDSGEPNLHRGRNYLEFDTVLEPCRSQGEKKFPLNSAVISGRNF